MNWLSTQLESQWDKLANAGKVGNFADIFGNGLVIGVLSICLVVWTLYAAVRLSRGVEKLNTEIDAATALLLQTPRSAAGFVGRYEETAASLEDAAVIGPAWRDWTATLIMPTQVSGLVRSTVRPDSYFSLELLRSCGVNPRADAATPNLLVGAGLLLTFFGLSLALSAAGGIVGPDVAQEARQNQLKSLLDVASAKFVTSLVGLLCSLIYTRYRASRLVSAERSMDRFYAALEERIPLATAATLQSETNVTLEKSLTVQSQFATEIAVNIGSKFDTSINERLNEHIGPLREAIERLSGNIGEKSEDTLRALVEEFKKSLHGGTQDYMERLSASLIETSGAMGQIREGLQDAAAKMAAAADQIAEQMGKSAGQAMEQITLQMTGLVEQLRALAEQSRTAGTEAMAEASLRIAEAGESFNDAAKGISLSIEDAMSNMTARLSSEAEIATKRMTEELLHATEALRNIAEESKTAGSAATQSMADRIAQAAAVFEASAAQVAKSLEGGAGDAASRLVSAVDELRGQFGKLSSELTGNMGVAGDQLVKQSRDGGVALAEAALAAAESLKVGGREGGDALRLGGVDAGQQVRSASDEISSSASALVQRIRALGDEATSLSRAAIDLRDGTLKAAGPLGESAAKMADAAQATQSTARDLARVTERLVPVAEAIGGAAKKLADVEQGVKTLTDGLTEALGGFEQLDSSLTGVFRSVNGGLDAFAKQVSDFVAATNNDMAKAVTGLSGAVEELSDLLEESGGNKFGMKG